MKQIFWIKERERKNKNKKWLLILKEQPLFGEINLG